MTRWANKDRGASEWDVLGMGRSCWGSNSGLAEKKENCDLRKYVESLEPSQSNDKVPHVAVSSSIRKETVFRVEVVEEFSLLKYCDVFTKDNRKVISFKCWNDYNRKRALNSFLQFQREQTFNLSSRVHPWKLRMPLTREQPIKSGRWFSHLNGFECAVILNVHHNLVLYSLILLSVKEILVLCYTGLIY